MIGPFTKWGVALAVLAMLAACSSSSDQANLETAEGVTPPPQPQASEPLPTGPLSAAQISKALSERSFTFSGEGRSGTITFYADGTFSYEEAGKGPGTGIWQSSDGKLCEAYNPTSFLPRGTPSTCNPFSSDGSVFTAGTIQLKPA